MKKITLVFRGDVRILCFGKDGWCMRNEGKPECDCMFVGFRRLDSIMYGDREMIGEIGSLFVPRVLKHVNGDVLKELGEHLISLDDADDVELPVSVEVDDDFNIADLYLMKDVNSFEGCDVLYLSNAFYLFDSVDMAEVSGEVDMDSLLSVLRRDTFALELLTGSSDGSSEPF